MTTRTKKGRPSAYRPGFAKQAFNLALLGATDADVARALDVSEVTINAWKKRYPTFLKSLKEGKDEADANVAKSLYRRALGYSHDAVKIVADAKTGSEHVVPYTERFPPDTVACIFWLKNRRPSDWRDKQAIEHTVPNGSGVLAVPIAPDAAQWAAGAAAQQAALVARPSTVPPVDP